MHWKTAAQLNCLLQSARSYSRENGSQSQYRAEALNEELLETSYNELEIYQD